MKFFIIILLFASSSKLAATGFEINAGAAFNVANMEGFKNGYSLGMGIGYGTERAKIYLQYESIYLPHDKITLLDSKGNSIRQPDIEGSAYGLLLKLALPKKTRLSSYAVGNIFIFSNYGTMAGLGIELEYNLTEHSAIFLQPLYVWSLSKETNTSFIPIKVGFNIVI